MIELNKLKHFSLNKIYRLKDKFLNISIRFRSIFSKNYIHSRYGPKFIKNWKDRTFLSYIFAKYGFYFSKYLYKYEIPFYFIDIGSNQGLYSLIASENINCVCAIAIEPCHSTFKLLQKNIAINKAQSKIKSYKHGISNEDSYKELFFDQKHTGAASLTKTYSQDEKTIAEFKDYKFFETLNLNKGINIICKIDVEGHELEVITQLIRSCLISDLKTIFFECDECWVDKSKIQDKLKSIGFTSFKKIGKGKNHYDIISTK
tara:strand:+ start:270 stop:1049 length:780 start_codon:yes stop_codon:yes gene_type:complete